MNEYQDNIRKLKKETKKLPAIFIDFRKFINNIIETESIIETKPIIETKEPNKADFTYEINNLNISIEVSLINEYFFNTDVSEWSMFINKYPINNITNEIIDIFYKKNIIYQVGLNDLYLISLLDNKKIEYYGCDKIINKEIKNHYINGCLSIENYFDINNIRSIRLNVIDKLKSVDILICNIACKNFDDFLTICILSNDITNNMLIKIHTNEEEYKKIIIYSISIYKNVYVFKYLDDLFLLCDKFDNKINTHRLISSIKKK